MCTALLRGYDGAAGAAGPRAAVRAAGGAFRGAARGGARRGEAAAARTPRGDGDRPLFRRVRIAAAIRILDVFFCDTHSRYTFIYCILANTFFDATSRSSVSI